MSASPKIFISTVTKELGSARKLVADILRFLGCESIYQEDWSAPTGVVRSMFDEKLRETARELAALPGCCVEVAFSGNGTAVWGGERAFCGVARPDWVWERPFSLVASAVSQIETASSASASAFRTVD